MPILEIFTSVKAADIPATFLDETTREWQATIGKPTQLIHVHLVPSQMMTFGGTTQPCACVKVTSIGGLGLEKNKTITKAITQMLAKIGVKADRMFVLFNDIAAQDVGHNGTTFAN